MVKIAKYFNIDKDADLSMDDIEDLYQKWKMFRILDSWEDDIGK